MSYFGEDDDYDYLDFWAGLRANDVQITDGWETAYFTNFSKYGGDQPLVVSYATSPAAEFIFSETPLEEPPTGNILFDRSVFLQIEGMGVLLGADSPNLARKFIDFALDLQFQEGLSGQDVRVPCEPERDAAGLLAVRGGAGGALGHRAGGDQREARGVDRGVDASDAAVAGAERGGRP